MGTVKSHLLEDHREIERLLVELRDAVEGAEAPTIQQIWSAFERRLMAHLDAEDRYLLPLIESARPEASRKIREEHAQIRRQVAQLGLECDLHMVRKSKADDLINRLRRHAAWEDEQFYPFLDDLTRRPVVGRLRSAVTRALRGPRSPRKPAIQ